MAYVVEQINGCTKKFAFSFESIDLEDKIQDSLKKKQANSALKGFRKGKAPISLIQKMYGPQAESDALNQFVQQEFFQAIQKEDVKAVGMPVFANSNYEADKKSISFDVTVETYPEVPEVKLDHLSFTKDEVKVDETEVEKLKKNYLESKVQMKSIEDDQAEIEKGHFVILDFEGEKENGEKPENMKASEYQLEIGSNSFIPGFEDALVGLKAGDEKTIDLTFPETYHVDELKNAKVKFHVKIHEIKTKVYPEFTDELAKEFGFDSVEDFQTKTLNNLKLSKEREVKEKLNQEILEKLVEECTFDLPVSMVQQQEEYLKEDIKKTLKSQGFDDANSDEYFKKWGGDMNSKAVFQVKSGLILNKLAEKFEIETSESDLEKKYEEMAHQSGMKLEEIKKFYGTPEMKKNLMYAVREERTFAKIYDSITLN